MKGGTKSSEGFIARLENVWFYSLEFVSASQNSQPFRQGGIRSLAVGDNSKPSAAGQGDLFKQNDLHLVQLQSSKGQ